MKRTASAGPENWPDGERHSLLGDYVLIVENRPKEAAELVQDLHAAGFAAWRRLQAGSAFEAPADKTGIALALVGIEHDTVEAAVPLVTALRAGGIPWVFVVEAADGALDRLLALRPCGILCAPYTQAQFRATLRVALARGIREAQLRRQIERTVQRAESGEARVARFEDQLRKIASELAPFAQTGGGSLPPVLPARCQALLSRRELEVLRAFTNTGQVDLVARELGLAVATVRNHLKAIYRKMDVHSQSELIQAVRALSAAAAQAG